MRKLTQKQKKLLARVFAGKSVEQMVGVMDCEPQTISKDDMNDIYEEIIQVGNRLMGKHWTNQGTIDSICAALFPNRK